MNIFSFNPLTNYIMEKESAFFNYHQGYSKKGNFIVAVLSGILLLLIPVITEAQHRDVPYVPTPNDVVEKMLDVANVGPGDYVIDLGSGDGRIVIAAAKRGAYAHGVDIDPQRIREANANAKAAGVEDKVVFVEGNIFETDFSMANVLTMYLLNSVNLKLRPKILEILEPGTRVVSHSFNMNDWKADDQFNVNHSNIYYWEIPAKAEGEWRWQVNGKRFTMNVSQEFQEVDIKLKSDNTSLNVNDDLLAGDRLTFTAENPSKGERYIFSGRIEDGTIDGIVQIHNSNDATVEKWTATNGKVSAR
jgi:SAM-dependent methyltransferase